MKNDVAEGKAEAGPATEPIPKKENEPLVGPARFAAAVRDTPNAETLFANTINVSV